MQVWKALEGSFKMTAKDSDVLEIWAWFQHRDIAPNEGGDFIISDGQIHGTALRGGAGKWKLTSKSFWDITQGGETQ